MCVIGVCCCLCKYSSSIQLRRSFQLNLWPDFLAGRVPRRKNFAGSFGKGVSALSNKDYLIRQLIHRENQFENPC
jgi:hypothetical protein